MSVAIRKLDPRYSMYLRGFDRRGAAAALTQATSSGFKVSGVFSDIADFVVLVLHDADDVFGHLHTSKYLPDFDLSGMVLGFDLAVVNGIYPGSAKFQSVPWGKLSFICRGVVNTSGTSVSWVSGSTFTSLAVGGSIHINSKLYTISTIASSISLTVSATAGTQTGVSLEAAGTAPLTISALSGNAQASTVFTIGGTAAGFDRVYIVFQGNTVFEYLLDGSDTLSTVVNSTTPNSNGYSGLAKQINDAHTADPVACPITASGSGPNLTVTGANPGTDGNTIQLWAMYKAAGTTTVSPAGAVKLTGGIDPTSFHASLDFNALGLTDIRQCWLTLAPSLQIDSGAGTNTLGAFIPKEFSYTFSSWAVTGGSRALKVAGPNSTLVSSSDGWASYSGDWRLASNTGVNSGFYYYGFAKYSSIPGDRIVIKYSSSAVHDLYLGTTLFTDRGVFDVTLDGATLSSIDTYLSVGTALPTRRRLAASVAAGTHTVVLTVSATKGASSTNYTCLFDYLHAAVLTDIQDPATSYSTVGVAFDYDTDQTYKLSPQRSLLIARKAGFLGDVDFYAGVFFGLKRIRYGGSFNKVIVTLAGTPNYGNGLTGNADSIFIQFGGTSFGDPSGTVLGVSVFPADDLTSLAQRFVDAVNSVFVGVWAQPTATAGEFEISITSPINGFPFYTSLSQVTWNSGSTYFTGQQTLYSGDVYVSLTGPNVGSQPDISPTDWSLVGIALTLVKNGNVDAGNEGTWRVDESQADPLNKAFQDFLADFCDELVANSMTCTVAWSQELLNPPDQDTAPDAWSQRYSDGTTVLTATGFGSWGTGFVDGVSTGMGGVYVIESLGHGYVTGNIAHLANNFGSGSWYITVTNADHFELTTAIQILTDTNTGLPYVPSVGDALFIELQTTQCSFNSATVTAYLKEVFRQTAQLMAASSLIPWLQFGEVGHWFFSRYMSLAISSFTNSGGLVKVSTVNAHNFSTGQTVILAGTRFIDGTRTITVINANSFTINGSMYRPNIASGTVSGGGMAFYDANQTAAATVALGRDLADFWTQDDDPAINAGADADFLADRIKDHTDAIVAYVLGVEAGSKFEVLWPYDVDFSPCYYTVDLPYPQGGRLNHAVNLPAGWTTKVGSNLDRFKLESLSWGSFYRNIDNAKAAASYGYRTLSWGKADVAYLIPWFNGGCPFGAEFAFAKNESLPLINFWAFDHLTLLSWRVPVPINRPSSGFS